MFGWNFGGNQDAGGPGGFFGGLFGNEAAQEFVQEYQCFPSSFMGREEIDKGNKIILPSSALDQLARLNISYPMLFKLTNAANDISTHCGVLEFVAEEGTCYMPYWMMRNLVLKEGDIVTVHNVTLPKGTYVKLQPVTKDFLDINNPKAVLENSLRWYATLTTGDNIVINYNKKNYEIEIVQSKPRDAISIIEADIEVDFAPPKDYVEPQPAQALTQAQPQAQPLVQPQGQSNAASTTLFSGQGFQLNGKPLKSLGTSATPEENLQPWKQRVPGGVKRVPPYGYKGMKV